MKNHSESCRRISFALLGLLVAVMAAATFIEHHKGTDFAASRIYYSWWFALLWAATAASGLCWLLRAARRRFSLLLLHGAWAVILTGAGLSALTSKSGQLHLRQGETAHTYLSEAEGHPSIRLPFRVRLDRFDVDYHHGTTTASDYRSLLTLTLPDGTVRQGSVSMNKVLTAEGVRLYQMSYDSDGGGSILSVRSDPWGQPLTYMGYALLLLGLVGTLLDPQGGFRRALRSPLLRGSKAAACALLLAGTGFLPTASAQPTLPAPTAENFGKLYVEYGGRICPMQTLAQDFCRKVYGAPRYGSFTAEQVMAGWIFWPDEWNKEPLIQVKSRALRQRFDLGRHSAFNDFFLDGYRLGPLVQGYYSGLNPALGKAAAEVDDRIMLIYSLRRADLLKLFPVRHKNGGGGRADVQWITPTATRFDSLEVAPRDSAFIRDVFSQMFLAAKAGRFADVDRSIRAIYDYQTAHAAGSLPQARTVRAERTYNALNLPTWLYRTNLTLGLLLFGFMLVRTGRAASSSLGTRRIGQAGRIGLQLLLWAGFGLLTWYMALRTLVSGRLPLGNGFETMLSVAWAALLLAIVCGIAARRTPWSGFITASGFLISGFFLLVASLSQSSAQISPLVPVLSSPLLSLHVSIIMLSYALLSFTFLSSLTALVTLWRGGGSPQAAEQGERLRQLSTVILHPAIVLLACGIFIGAIWANLSWGRYWGWDPKEVWALITLLVYVLPLHSGSLPAFRRQRNFHLYLALAFLTVLMTYFGVNYVLGGMHSYAG